MTVKLYFPISLTTQYCMSVSGTAHFAVWTVRVKRPMHVHGITFMLRAWVLHGSRTAACHASRAFYHQGGVRGPRGLWRGVSPLEWVRWGGEGEIFYYRGVLSTTCTHCPSALPLGYLPCSWEINVFTFD